MHCEDLFVDDGRNWQAIEAVGERLPQFDVISSLALIIEAIDTVDRGALVVPTQDEEVLWVFDLVGEQQTDRFEGLLSTVDVIAEKEVVGLGGEAAVLKKTQKVVVLAVDITTDLWSVSANHRKYFGLCCLPLSALPTRAEWAER